jgi:pimeloyl-ACP methyl ester carboxylesterase
MAEVAGHAGEPRISYFETFASPGHWLAGADGMMRMARRYAHRLWITSWRSGTDGPPVILLHGWPSDPHDWDGVAPPLAGDGCRVLVPWLRGYGATRFLAPSTPRSGQQAALGADVRDFMDALGIERALLVGYDWGGRGACVCAALWRERVRGLVSINGYNIQNIPTAGRPGTAAQEHRHWYQWYFHTERGRAGLQENRRDIARLLWRRSPNWQFDDATFEATASSFRQCRLCRRDDPSYRHHMATRRDRPEPLNQRPRSPPINVPMCA